MKALQFAFDNVLENEKYNDTEQLEILQECIEAGINPKDYPNILSDAIHQWSSIEIIKFLIDNWANVNGDKNDRPLNYICNIKRTKPNKLAEIKQLEITKLLILAGVNIHIDNPISKCKTLPMIKLLVEHGADPFVSQYDLLLEACRYGDVEIVNYLLEIGAQWPPNIDETISNIFFNYDFKNKDKKYHEKYIEIIKILLENGASPNVTFDDDDISLLEISAKNLSIDLCKILLQYGADVNLCTNLINGKIKLKKHNLEDKQKIVDLFMEHGLDLSEKID